MKPDDFYLILAERIDSLRIVPRVLVFGYCFWYGYFLNRMWEWYAHLPAGQQTPVNAGMFTAVGAVLTILGTQIFNIYSSGGRDWNATSPPTSPP